MRYRHGVLTLLFLLSIITYLDRVCIGVASATIQDELKISPDKWGWVIGAFTISYAAFEIPMGSLGDRIGPRRVLAGLVLWWSAFTSLTGLVSSYVTLLGTRFLFGIGEAGAFPNAAVTISRWFPLKQRARATGVMWMGSRVGGALSSILMVQIILTLGWRTAFFLFGAVGVAWATAWFLFFRDRPREMSGISAVELDEIGPLPAGPAHAKLPWSIALRSRNLWTIMVMYHTYCWGSYFYLSWFHTYLERGRGFSKQEMGVFGMSPFLIGACCTVLGGWLSDRLVKSHGLTFGRRSVGAVGLALSAAFMFATALTPNKFLAVLFLSLGYGAMDCMLPVSWAVCQDVGRQYSGTVSGAMNMAGQVASFLSSVYFGYMLTWFNNDYNLPLIPMAGMLLISAILFLRIDPTEELIREGTVGESRKAAA